jgi:hypothetical protein
MRQNPNFPVHTHHPPKPLYFFDAPLNDRRPFDEPEPFDVREAVLFVRLALTRRL